MRVVLPARHYASSLHQNDLRNNFQEKVRASVTATFSLKKRELQKRAQPIAGHADHIEKIIKKMIFFNTRNIFLKKDVNKIERYEIIQTILKRL
jgi:hypothetical protein